MVATRSDSTVNSPLVSIVLLLSCIVITAALSGSTPAVASINSNENVSVGSITESERIGKFIVADV